MLEDLKKKVFETNLELVSKGLIVLTYFGTTHADYFYGAILCTRQLEKHEIENDYEYNTGEVIVETFRERGPDYEVIPAMLVNKHGPFV